MLELKIILWLAIGLIIYTYAGYPVVLALLPGGRYAPPAEGAASAIAPGFPSVTLIIPACNEARWIERKIENALALDYPRSLLEIIVASDGSSDGTAEIAQAYEPRGVTVAAFPARIGKQEMLNHIVPCARGEIVAMTDTNAMLMPDALTQLMRPFADPRIGCAIGRRVCIVQHSSAPSVAESLYWRYESWIKREEARWHSCLAATGQLFAVRRSVFPRVERVGEDFFIPMKILASTGLRVAYAPEAVAAIPAAATLAAEFERKTRAHVSFLLSVPMLKDLLVPGRTPVWWQFISHHVLRMFVPPAMVVVLLCSIVLATGNRMYFLALLAQMVFYVCALAGWRLSQRGRCPKVFYFSFYFVFVHLALLQAWLRWPLGKYEYAWQRTERLPDAS